MIWLSSTNDELSKISIPDSQSLISFSLIFTCQLKATYICINVEVRLDRSRPTEQKLVFDDVRTGSLALDVDAVGSASDDVAALDEHE